MLCPIHGKNCPGDDGGFLIDGNHPDDMFAIGEAVPYRKVRSDTQPTHKCRVCKKPSRRILCRGCRRKERWEDIKLRQSGKLFREGSDWF